MKIPIDSFSSLKAFDGTMALPPEPPWPNDEDAPIELLSADSVFPAQPSPATVAQPPFRASGAYRAPSGKPLPLVHPQLGQEALHGLAGDVVGTMGPETEADPVALLVHLLVMFGACVGRTPRATVGATIHTANLFAVMVGTSSKGRKGTAGQDIRALFSSVDQAWERERIQAGLSSGEGLIWAVRDPIYKKEPIREGKGSQKRIVDYQSLMVDEGVSDKRLQLLETEFAGVLRVLERDGNTLSAILRQAWDSGTLRTLTKNFPAVATDAHIAAIGHITRDELLRYLNRTESANGFGNRFLWFLVKQSKLLSEGGALAPARLAALQRELSAAVTYARAIGQLRRNPAARDRWAEIYAELAGERSGLAGAITSRAEAQVLRLSMIYALLDRSDVITPHHLEAALAVWRYAEDSVDLVFGDSIGDALADEILRALRASVDGMTRDQIRDLFQRHQSSERIGRSLEALARASRAAMMKEATAGRPVERWRAVADAARKARYARKAPREPGEDDESGTGELP